MNQEQLLACSLACSFLGRMFLAGPDRNFLQQLHNDDLFTLWPLPVHTAEGVKGLQLLKHFVNACDHESLEQARRDYSDLYVGPADIVPIWESVWTSKERLLFEDSAMDVRQTYARLGFETADRDHQPDDHFGLELSFLAALFSLAAQADESGDTEDMRTMLEEARSFMQKHLGVWSGEFLDATAARATTGLFQGVALLGRDSLLTIGKVLENSSVSQ